MLFALFVGLLMGGCSKSYIIKPLPHAGTEVQFDRGRECLISNKNHTILLGPKPGGDFKSGRRAKFVASVKNGSNIKFSFSTDEIDVHYEDSSGGIIPLTIFTFEELAKEERRRQAWAAVGAGLQAMGDSLNAANAGYSNTYGSYSGNTYSSYGNSYQHTGRYSATTYNHAAAQAAQSAAQAKSDANFRRIAEDSRRNHAALARSSLRRHTIMPGQWHGGEIQFDLPNLTDSGRLNFVIRANKENHRFSFNINKPDKISSEHSNSIRKSDLTNPKSKTLKAFDSHKDSISNKEQARLELFRLRAQGKISQGEYKKRMLELN